MASRSSLSVSHSAAICTAIGSRLCTAAELQAEETRGSGCGHDAEWVWSSDMCPQGHLVAVGGKVHLESGLMTAADALRERGHEVVTGTGVFGGYQAILRDPESGVYHGASESRKDGYAAGW